MRCGSRRGSSRGVRPSRCHEPRHAASTIRSSSCRRESAAPSSPCGISAAPSTMRWTRRPVGHRRRRPAGAVARRAGGLLLRRSGRQPKHDARTQPAAVHPRVQPAAPAVRGSDRRRRDGSGARALSDVRGAGRILPPRGLCRRPHLRRDFRLSRIPPRAAYAVNLGMALQLTNIIRDVAPDLRNGRVYLPAEDLARFRVTEDDLRAGRVTPAVRDLMRFECERARSYYAKAAADAPAGRRRSLLAAEIMGGHLFRNPAAHRAQRATTCSARAFACPSVPCGDCAPRSGCARCPSARLNRRRHRDRRRLCRTQRRHGCSPSMARACSSSKRGPRSAVARRRSPTRRRASAWTTVSTSCSAVIATPSRFFGGLAPRITCTCRIGSPSTSSIAAAAPRVSRARRLRLLSICLAG